MKSIAAWVLALASAGAACGGVEEGSTPNLFDGDRFLHLVHRGGGHLYPEETLVAYENSLRIGADVLEIDLHTTRDGVPVAMHDDTVDRVTDGSGPVHGFTLEEIRRLDAGYGFTPDGGLTFPYRGQGVQVATLEEILSAFTDTYFLVEIKQSDPPMVDAALSAIERTGMADRIVIGAFNQDITEEIRRKAPQLRTYLGTGEVIDFVFLTPETEAEYTPPDRWMSVPPEQGIPVVTVEFMARARRLGMKVYVWSINDPAEMNDLIDLGVDGIMTDEPVRLEAVIEERGLNP